MDDRNYEKATSTIHCKPFAISPLCAPLRDIAVSVCPTYYHIKAQRILAEAETRRNEASQPAAEQTNLMRVHNDTNLNDNARCVCLQD